MTPDQRKGLLLALGLGGAGGAAFAFAGAPLAWLLGAMVVTTVATLFGAKPYIPASWRTIMIAVLGIMLGSAFRPEMASELPGWLDKIGIMVIYLFVLVSLGTFFLRRVANYDPVTAYFSAVPGGLSEMTVMGEEAGGDIRVISLTHATRILIAVSTIPVWFRVVEQVSVPVIPDAGTTLATLQFTDVLILTVLGIVGVPIGKLVRLPASALVGPMMLSAIAHITGLIEAAPPNELLALAQVIVGTSIGARFIGLGAREMRSIISYALVLGLVYVGFAVVAGAVFAPLTDIDSRALVLSFAPGGLAEMTLIALAIGIETAFVSAMHVARITMVVIVAPTVFKLMRRD